MSATTKGGTVDILMDVHNTLREVEDVGRDQQFGLGHLVELLRLVADDGGKACLPGPDNEIDSLAMQGRWLRIEYLADRVEDLKGRAGRVAA